MDLRFVDLDLAVLCFALPLDLGADEDDGPALVEGVRLGGLKGSRRFFCAGLGEPAILVGCVKCEW